MKPLIFRVLCCLVGASAFALPPQALAQTPPTAVAEVEVGAVKFNGIRQSNGPGTWFEAEVEVVPKPGPGFINRVKVTLNLGIEAGLGSKKRTDFYRASAEAVALDAGGGRVFYRFYLPPEIVKRDGIKGDIKYYVIELSVAGKSVPVGKNNVSAFFTTSQLMDSFLSKVSSEAGVNDGILFPQHLTIFSDDNGKPTPTMLRLENAH
jgi:hypothetical protein